MNPNFARILSSTRSKDVDHDVFAWACRWTKAHSRTKVALHPVPLSEKEEALMAFAACGVTGCALADLSYAPTGGGNIMAGLIGRTIASGDGIQNGQPGSSRMIPAPTSIAGPQDMPPKDLPALIDYGEKDDFIKAAERMRVRISDKRTVTKSEPIYNINANRWSVHAAGTSYYLPVNELTFMYINGLLEILNESTGVYVLDERAGFRPAGLAKFAKSKGGHLSDNPAEGKVATIALIERLVTEFVTVEQGMMLQNLGLMAQALGLGGFPNFAITISRGLKHWVLRWNACLLRNISVCVVFRPSV
jgi:hypothetical protein